MLIRFILNFVLVSLAVCERIVTLPGLGDLKSQVWLSSLKHPYDAFTTVPYADPPPRFQPAKMKSSGWSGIRDSKDYEQTICAQMDFHEVTKGIEDCLYVNVYVPTTNKPPSDGVKRKLPVMVWIHGGGFFAGSGNPDIYGPDYFMDYDVIVVTVNYRVGPLGFFTLENEEAPGNLGLRDQILSLEWVKKYIEFFDGDPDNVTLFGESAGSMSVLYLMVSPLTKGLFHRIIAQSGSFISSFCHWDKRAGLYGDRLATAMGCSGDAFVNNSTELSVKVVDCLRRIEDPMSFAGMTKLFLHYPWTGPNVWKPFVDGHFSKNPVLPDDPETLLESGNYNQVPIIIGSNSDEGILNLAAYLQGNIKFDDVDENWDSLGPLILFHRSLDETMTEDVKWARKIKKFYFGENGKISWDHLDGYKHLMGDHMFYAGIEKTVRLLTKTSAFPVYRYMYSHVGPLSTIDSFALYGWQTGIKMLLRYFFDFSAFDLGLGVCHADEIFLMFHPHIFPASPFTIQDQKVNSRLLAYWTNFAKTGDPNVGLDVEFEWKSTESPSHLYLNISQADQMSLEYNEAIKKRCDFWLEILDDVRRYRNFLSAKPPLTEDEVLTLPKKVHEEL